MSRVIEIEYKLQDAQTLEILQSSSITNVVGKDGMESKALPFILITGRNNIPISLENIITEMKVGEEKVNILLKAEELYEEHDSSKITTLDIEQFPNKEDLVIGNRVSGVNGDGQLVSILIKSFTDTEVTIDYNHKYVGLDMLFSVKILSSRIATIKEVASGFISPL